MILELTLLLLCAQSTEVPADPPAPRPLALAMSPWPDMRLNERLVHRSELFPDPPWSSTPRLEAPYVTDPMLGRFQDPKGGARRYEVFLIERDVTRERLGDLSSEALRGLYPEKRFECSFDSAGRKTRVTHFDLFDPDDELTFELVWRDGRVVLRRALGLDQSFLYATTYEWGLDGAYVHAQSLRPNGVIDADQQVTVRSDLDGRVVIVEARVQGAEQPIRIVYTLGPDGVPTRIEDVDGWSGAPAIVTLDAYHQRLDRGAESPASLRQEVTFDDAGWVRRLDEFAEGGTDLLGRVEYVSNEDGGLTVTTTRFDPSLKEFGSEREPFLISEEVHEFSPDGLLWSSKSRHRKESWGSTSIGRYTVEFRERASRYGWELDERGNWVVHGYGNETLVRRIDYE